MEQLDKPKPHNTAVIAAMLPTADDYPTKLSAIIVSLQKQKAEGHFIDLYKELRFIDSTRDNSMLVDWLRNNHIADKAKFDRILKAVKRDEAIEERLGFVPRDVTHYVEQWIDRHGYTVTFLGEIRCTKPVSYGGDAITAQDLEQDKTGDLTCVYETMRAMPRTILQVKRDLRLDNDTLRLNFKDSAINDAVDRWEERQKQQHKVRLMLDVKYERGQATGPTGQKMWTDMEQAAFDLSDTHPGFAAAVIRKFMWQVKRKALGKPVTRHLMPVITGVQNRGKSTFVETMCGPVADMMKRVNFSAITDDRIIVIWEYGILFVDEMAAFNRADDNAIKDVITASTLTRRPMRENRTVPVRQSATLIGTSNFSLAQLSKDTTGGRRFAELVWKADPDFAVLNSIDWQMMWQSVDPNGDDPLSGELYDMLTKQQEDNRAQSPVETWARDNSTRIKDWRKAAELHTEFREWEADAFPRAQTDINTFGRTLTSLINSRPDFPLEKSQRDGRVVYRSR